MANTKDAGWRFFSRTSQGRAGSNPLHQVKNVGKGKASAKPPGKRLDGSYQAYFTVNGEMYRTPRTLFCEPLVETYLTQGEEAAKKIALEDARAKMPHYFTGKKVHVRSVKIL